MKHNFQLIILLTFLFLIAQIIGLVIISHYLPETSQLPLNIEKPDIDEKTAYLPIFIAIILASVVILLLMKFKAFSLWKIWFLLSVFITLTIAFSAFIPPVILSSTAIPQLIAIFLAIILSIIKIYKPNVYIHNLTELFIYGGLAAIFVPIFSILSASILLILISIYDAIAVWKTKHMIKMAEAQKEIKVFAGMSIPYKQQTASKKSKTKQKITAAILGGGDIGFPMIFAGAVLKTSGFIPAILIAIFASASLFLLFYFAEKEKYYPAMPFLSAGCFFGYLITILIF